MVTPDPTFKNRLQEYAQKKCLQMPIYHTVNEGPDHLPLFRCSVTINGKKYESPPGFSHKKAAQNAAAKEAVEYLQRRGFKFKKERKRPRCVLAELASMKSIPAPTYHFIKSVTAIVEINGVSYVGSPGSNLKEAANKAALEAIWSIDPQCGIALTQHESSNSESDPLPVQQGLEKKDTGDAYEENEGMQKSNQEVDFNDSIPLARGIDTENAERM